MCAEGIEPSLPPRQGGVRPQHFAHIRRTSTRSAQRGSNPRLLLGREVCSRNTLHAKGPFSRRRRRTPETKCTEGFEPSPPPWKGGVRPTTLCTRETTDRTGAGACDHDPLHTSDGHLQSAQRGSNPRFLLGRKACSHNTLHAQIGIKCTEGIEPSLPLRERGVRPQHFAHDRFTLFGCSSPRRGPAAVPQHAVHDTGRLVTDRSADPRHAPAKRSARQRPEPVKRTRTPPYDP